MIAKKFTLKEGTKISVADDCYPVTEEENNLRKQIINDAAMSIIQNCK